MTGALGAFLRTRQLAKSLRTRADIDAWQADRIRQWREKVLNKFPHYGEYGNKAFESLPVIDKSILMADFAAFNRLNLAADEGWAMFEGRVPHRPGYAVGASTGTSGNRGLYVISDAERYEWLGVVLAKALPRFPFETARIALILPLNSALYKAANLPGLRLRFFDLHDGLDAILPAVAAYGPDTVIAPPKVLRALAESDARLNLKRLFSGAEVLDPLDRTVIEDRFQVAVREIYMATEGLLGVACEHGTLHLAEDAVRFEWERPVPDSDLVAPVITDFTRTTQAMCRYRMNDLLRLSSTPCPCGSPLQAVAAIEGRCDDLLVLNGKTVTPDILRNTIVDADRRIDDFRLRQTGPAHLHLTLSDTLPTDAAASARNALQNRLAVFGVTAEIALSQEPLKASARKLRRVERQWKG
ncbi:MAG TPA: F390 synthetase-related protein [Asticcacaulis sp.]|nr:F390 synthetase-related protein [Asticcacaulis sp.]